MSTKHKKIVLGDLVESEDIDDLIVEVEEGTFEFVDNLPLFFRRAASENEKVVKIRFFQSPQGKVQLYIQIGNKVANAFNLKEDDRVILKLMKTGQYPAILIEKNICGYRLSHTKNKNKISNFLKVMVSIHARALHLVTQDMQYQSVKYKSYKGNLFLIPQYSSQTEPE